jgi:hypothetical protein
MGQMRPNEAVDFESGPHRIATESVRRTKWRFGPGGLIRTRRLLVGFGP